MPSTPGAYPQVISRCFTSFQVPKPSICPVQSHICGGFDSRQLRDKDVARRSASAWRPPDVCPQPPRRAQTYSDRVVESDEDRPPIPHIYTLAEAAKALRVPGDWLRTRLANGTFAGLRRGNRWAMTEHQIMAVIDSMTVPAREPESYPGCIRRRSWLYRQRRREGRAPPTTLVGPASKVKPAPSWYRMVCAESLAETGCPTNIFTS
jgi:hypothetical protein